ncbi:GNAT family N-acetyltransferase [Priestia endophytica]|uniref:N-acetyltransferase n=1 Tax=Priestia endophytica TaxID=135735 RepID=A0AAX1Q8S7_9BACI|nr:GNAT family N-acetyltransferase [Priestia endophytica]RAS77669.1 N-acetyltransferase [Priestia endophytica]RAS92978.1 N-acetyltransferase [Priestia endophytica]
MRHIKTYHAKEIKTKQGPIIVEGPIQISSLKELHFHEGLTAFRPSDQQKEALLEISGLEEGRIIVARYKDTVVGYVTFLYPDPLERWSEGNLENLIELGAIEVAPPFREISIGKTLLEVSMMDKMMENYIIITTEYYWHWDLKGTGLNVWEYRKAMEKMMETGGLTWVATDDPEICSHPANCLMARFGKKVNHESVQKFDQLRFQNRFMY